MIDAKIVLDSINPVGCRLTTMEVTCNRYILAELNTHRAFSRNSASSRARSVNKTIDEVFNNTAFPPIFNSERKGMSGGSEIRDPMLAKQVWQEAADSAVLQARKLVELGVHKSIVNRILEPYMWHTVILTSSNWSNFFEQRLALLEDDTPASDPAMYLLAQKMYKALDESKPKELKAEELHTPFITQRELEVFGKDAKHYSTRVALSVARCAGVSYLNQNTVREQSKDLELFRKLLNAKPPHWSPFEHVAKAKNDSCNYHNLNGWKSYRFYMEVGTPVW